MTARKNPAPWQKGRGNSTSLEKEPTAQDTPSVTVTELDGATPSELLEEFGGDLTEMSERELDAIVAAAENRDTPEILTGAAGDAYAELHRRTAEARAAEQAKADRAILAELAELQRAVKAAEKDTSRPAPSEATGDLGDWLRDTPWSEVLLPAGFLQDGSDSQCGCDTWTAPGVHDSSKSAVTHDEGCRKFDQSDGGRLHIWTDNPSTSSPMDDAVADGRRDFSKLQALALLAHGGDELTAMDAENIDRDTVASYGRELTMAKPKVSREDVLSAEERVFTGPVLGTLREIARDELAGPWSFLGALLVRTAAVVGPTATVAGLSMAEAPLTLHTAVVGPSGGGKSLAHKVIRPLLRWEVHRETREEVRRHVLANALRGLPEDEPERTEAREEAEEQAEKSARMWGAMPRTGELSTGQGFVAAFDEYVGDPDSFGARMLWAMDEVDALAAHGKQRDSILLPSINSGWTGDSIGQFNADPTKRRNVREGTYSYGLSVNVQPARSGPILDGADSGGPQRYLWVPIEDFSDRDEPDHAAERNSFSRPSGGRLSIPMALHKPRRFVMPTSAYVAYRRQRWAATHDEAWNTTTNAHRILNRAKIAALLEVINGALTVDPHPTSEVWTIQVSEESWAMAGDILTVSDYTMAKCMEAVAETAHKESAAKGKAQHRTEAARAAAEDEAIQAVADRLAEVVDAAGGRMSWSEARKKVTRRHRHYVPQAVEADDRLTLERSERGQVIVAPAGTG